MREAVCDYWLVFCLAVAGGWACGESSPAVDGRPCPAGTRLAGGEPPRDDERWCARPNGTRHGPWAAWFDADTRRHKREEGAFADGKRQGRWTWWRKNGKRSAEGTFRAGKLEGEYANWHDNGQRRLIGRYRDGKMIGPWQRFHPNGALAANGEFRDGKKDGPWRYFHPSGAAKESGTYALGAKQGEWTTWTEAGAVEEVVTYEGGEPVSRRVPSTPPPTRDAGPPPAPR